MTANGDVEEDTGVDMLVELLVLVVDLLAVGDHVGHDRVGEHHWQGTVTDHDMLD